MTTTTSEPRTLAPPHWSLDRDGSSVGFTVKTMWGLIPVRRPTTLLVKALLKRDADGRHHD